MRKTRMFAALIAGGIISTAASARTICTIVADASENGSIVQSGDCTSRFTPASTFKIAISLMGFDAGVLQDEHTPAWPYQPEYPDWGGAAWRQPTDASRWIQYSVVWFSQRVAQQLGATRFQRYTRDFRYGNQDVSGEPGKRNGTKGAWINSSLRISPLEQIAFLRRLVNRQLPVNARAYEMTGRITRITAAPDGWEIHGKTGTGSPGSDGRYDPAHAYGWFVGWAIKDDRKLVFARLIQDDRPTQPNAGLRARDGLLDDLPALTDHLAGRPR
ncbi:class D beta-lactamase [Herbaspirillum seropedicae]|uniref:Beta-lactamase n=1 Tax=Herbaspirillum seropedicae (strain SmR1) TaxID=757424 RepID=D8IQF9_HERSS|nr:oxacillin hydrolase (class-D beta-lactamase) signal peptide protein [Herbaspirillum seropedicae SmR1]AKN66944.1 beta-lactamase [Herbaspirillum seropedicae]NQE28045.1 beta-lactamase [Herbaspirillum seropedicae]UMU22941.1 class D beta-lactamase [Herbaspirillum seropedicae]